MDKPQTAAVAEADPQGVRHPVINDFSIQVATVNGSGSQSSNTVLMKSIFQMGVPVSGKNLFPSNIAGLPTWFTIRANNNGYIARKAEIDFMVAMNPQTAREDAMTLQSGGALLAEESLNLAEVRDDIHYYGVPFSKLAGQVSSDARLKKLLANMVYVGVVAQLLSIDMEEVERAISKQFKAKPKAAHTNVRAVRVGQEYARDHLAKTDPFRLERMRKTHGKIMIEGNAAAALGAMFGGCTVVTWYPITPSSSLVEQLIEYMNIHRLDPETGKPTFAIIQAEDELAALGMVIGAGWAGARSMTSTSGPGISLMSEFVGLSYFAEIPAVIWDIQRIGPSTGLPTRTSQGDMLSTYLLSHGDTKHIMLVPSTVEECYQFAQEAFNLSEKFQTVVFCMSDLDLGMNSWMADPFRYPDDIPIDRGKVLSQSDLEKLGTFSRYLDKDGDAIPYRTLPGTKHPSAAYFTRGSGHNDDAEYTERPEDYVSLMNRLAQKFENAREAVPSPIIDQADNSKIGVIAYGSTHHAIGECRDQLKQECGLETDYLRIRGVPFSDRVRQFIDEHDRVYVVEQNRDAQMKSILSLDYPEFAMKLRSICHYTGIPIDARFITTNILEQEKERA